MMLTSTEIDILNVRAIPLMKRVRVETRDGNPLPDYLKKRLVQSYAAQFSFSGFGVSAVDPTFAWGRIMTMISVPGKPAQGAMALERVEFGPLGELNRVRDGFAYWYAAVPLSPKKTPITTLITDAELLEHLQASVSWLVEQLIQVY